MCTAHCAGLYVVLVHCMEQVLPKYGTNVEEASVWVEVVPQTFRRFFWMNMTQMVNPIFFLSIMGPARSTIMFSAPWDGITRSTDEHHFINCAALLGKMVLNVRHTEVLLLSKQTLPVSQKYLKCFNQHFCLHFPFLTNLNSSFFVFVFCNSCPYCPPGRC